MPSRSEASKDHPAPVKRLKIVRLSIGAGDSCVLGDGEKRGVKVPRLVTNQGTRARFGRRYVNPSARRRSISGGRIFTPLQV